MKWYTIKADISAVWDDESQYMTVSVAEVLITNLSIKKIYLLGSYLAVFESLSYLTGVTTAELCAHRLTHWPLGDLYVILKIQSSILFYWLVSSDLLMTMPSNETHGFLLTIAQHWSRLWLDAIRQQAITWANVDPVPCHHMAFTRSQWVKYERDIPELTDVLKIVKN